MAGSKTLLLTVSGNLADIFSDFDIFQENVTTLFPVIQIKVDSAESIVSK